MDLGRHGWVRAARGEQFPHQHRQLVPQAVRGEHRNGSAGLVLEICGPVGQVLQVGVDDVRGSASTLAWPGQPLRAERGQTVGDPAQLARRVAFITDDQLLPRRIAIRRSISMYSHTSVTTSP